MSTFPLASSCTHTLFPASNLRNDNHNSKCTRLPSLSTPLSRCMYRLRPSEVPTSVNCDYHSHGYCPISSCVSSLENSGGVRIGCFRERLGFVGVGGFGLGQGERMWKRKKEGGCVGAVSYAAPLTVRNIQWVSTIASAVLMLARGTPVQKSFLVPLFTLQASGSIISWMKGEYGVWAAFLALLVRLFFYIPGELELPFMVLLLVIVAPHQVINLRGTQEGAIISLLIAVYLGYLHFSHIGLQRAFDENSIVPTIAIICILVASLLLVI